MAKSQQNSDPVLSVESVSTVFSHDISTPLTTAKMNINLLLEHFECLSQALESPAAEHIPHHIKVAIQRAPHLISDNINEVQRSLIQYKAYLNSLSATPINDGQQINRPEVTTFSKKEHLNILLVDDENIHHDIGDAVLGASHTITHIKSGESAIDDCESKRYDVILMDMQMPGLPGPQTTEQLRTFIPTSTLVIGLSNMPIESKKQDLLECGFNGFLNKPLKLGEFNKLIESLSNGSD